MFKDFFLAGFFELISMKDYVFLLFVMAGILPFTFREFKSVLVILINACIGFVLSLAIRHFSNAGNGVEFFVFLPYLIIGCVALWNIIRKGAAPKNAGLLILYLLSAGFGLLEGWSSFGGFSGGIVREGVAVSLSGIFCGLLAAGLLTGIVLWILYFILDIFRIQSKMLTVILSAVIMGILIPAII